MKTQTDTFVINNNGEHGTFFVRTGDRHGNTWLQLTVQSTFGTFGHLFGAIGGTPASFLAADWTPEHIERIRRWEAVVSAANKRRKATFFAPINGDVLPIADVIEWSRTGRGGRQFDIFMQAQAGGGCTSDLGLCERAAA